MLSKKLTDEFVKIIQDDYKTKLSPEDLVLYANEFADFFKVLLTNKKESYEDEQKEATDTAHKGYAKSN